ncbi:MAG: hypothetical protein ACM37W_11265 [Actinomycetota bacterium]
MLALDLGVKFLPVHQGGETSGRLELQRRSTAAKKCLGTFLAGIR